jgi:hypothetical protein
MYYEARRLDATGLFTGTLSSNLPNPSSFMGRFATVATTSTGSAIAIDMMSFFSALPRGI